jgi:hypothetical protein
MSWNFKKAGKKDLLIAAVNADSSIPGGIKEEITNRLNSPHLANAAVLLVDTYGHINMGAGAPWVGCHEICIKVQELSFVG